MWLYPEAHGWAWPLPAHGGAQKTPPLRGPGWGLWPAFQLRAQLSKQTPFPGIC